MLRKDLSEFNIVNQLKKQVEREKTFRLKEYALELDGEPMLVVPLAIFIWRQIMGIAHMLRRTFWKVGFDIARFTPRFHPIARRKQILESCGIEVVLDVGANVGNYALELRHDIGYVNEIISFEPQRLAFQRLQTKTKNDARWEAFNYALGDIEEAGQINTSGHSECSSILKMHPRHLAMAPKSRIIGQEEIEIRRLDSLFEKLGLTGKRVYLKIDAQGYENKIIEGAGESLENIGTIQLEMSLVPLYHGEVLFPDMCSLMSNKGYSLVSIEPGYSDRRNAELVQVDGIFRRV